MTDFDTVDYFFDASLVDDPNPYFEHLRSKCPVTPLPHRGLMAVTGYEEAHAVFRDHATFSSLNAVAGPFPELPFEPEGDDVSELIAQNRHKLPMQEYLITQDPPKHTAQRGLLMRLLTPKRMKENEAFMWGLADRQIDEFIGNGTFEVLLDYAQPFALLVIADLLGVPEEDHRAFKSQLGAEHPQPSVDGDTSGMSLDPLAFLIETFSAYIQDRRREPREDVLTQLAAATYPDGTIPDATAVARTAAFVFAAGQDTTARLLSSALRIIGDHPEVQDLLRSDRERIPNFIEEVLRMEGPVKSMFRMARVATSVGGVDVPAGTTLLILPGAANRDPRQFEEPNDFRADRPSAREHVAFGRGIHSCPGGPLSRLEVQISLNRLLDRTADLRISEAEHGPPDARRYEYDPTFILRGLKSLHLEFTPDGDVP